MIRVATLLCLWCITSSVAWAQDDNEARARVLYQNGTTLYEEGQYEAAILAFEQGYNLSQLPAFLYNIANCYERLAEYDEAIKYLNQYRAFAAAEERERLERRIRAMEQRRDDAAAASTPPPPLPPPSGGATGTGTATNTTGPGPAPVGTVTPEPSRGRGGPAMLSIGGGLVLIGGATAALTYSRSQTWIDQGDQEAYEQLRPVNLAGVGAAGVGAGLIAVGGLGMATGWLSAEPLPGGGILKMKWSL